MVVTYPVADTTRSAPGLVVSPTRRVGVYVLVKYFPDMHAKEQLLPLPKPVYIVLASPFVHAEHAVLVDGYVPIEQLTHEFPTKIAPGGHGIAHCSRIRACQP